MVTLRGMAAADPTSVADNRPLDRIELGDAVASRLRTLILGGEFAPGSRLVETELASRFGTSRGPVRDGLAELERTGLVRSVNRRGSFVIELTAADVDEVYSLRTALELLAVTRAIPVATTATIDRLSEAVNAMDVSLAVNDAPAVGAADMAFHRAIVEAAQHRRLLQSWEGLADQTELMMQELSSVRPELQSNHGHHSELIAAFAARDVDRAVAVLADHLDVSRTTMVEHFSS